jgi:hypothetical protein
MPEKKKKRKREGYWTRKENGPQKYDGAYGRDRGKRYLALTSRTGTHGYRVQSHEEAKRFGWRYRN